LRYYKISSVKLATLIAQSFPGTWGETGAKKRSPVRKDQALNLRRRILDVFDVQDATLVLHKDNIQIADLADERLAVKVS